MIAKPWYQSRILWLNIVVAVGGAMLGFAVDLPKWAVIGATVAVAIANVVLRYNTDQGIE
jgi:uncharacterized membrane protein